ncbi:universal stress protein [Flavivirga aquimarina]|uniref:Universal stress protein n=1 Tax=Flavivirga aquimarina TaxID=2027862 RepID=A0ABT8W8E3_9FLAO|nr:universal stress protein [Flavivirga aquimarina]MDO5969337.1 universal stress protein [Flavivirga aquimarina]
MKSNKYKILVLSDLKDSSDTTIKTTANLTKFISGDIDLLYVKKPIDIVESDNQLSSMRTINRDYIASKNKIESIIKSIDKELNINYNMTYGNVKQTIKEHIETTNPDIIVIGKKRFNALKLSGDRITKFVLKKYKGVVLIASNENVLEPNEDLSLGVFNHSLNEDLSKKLMAYTQKPVKSFKIKKSSNKSEQDGSDATLKDTIEYVFEPNDNAISNLSNYVLKNNIDLLCINRENNDFSNASASGNLDINKVINKLNVSLLLTK